MRFWLHTNGRYTPGYDGSGFALPFTAQYIQELRTLLDMAQNAGVGLVISLWSFDMLQNQTGVPLANNRKLLTMDANTQAYIDNVLNPMVNALKGHPALLAWELFNEPEGMSTEFGWSYQRVSMSSIQRVSNKLAGAIHQIDPGALVTVGAWSFQSLTDFYGFTNYYSDARLVAAGGDNLGKLDFYEVHYYSWGGTSLSPFHHPAAYWGLDKPIVVGEFYAQDTFGVPAVDLFHTLYDNQYAGGWGWTYGNNWAQIMPGVQRAWNLHSPDITWTPGCSATATPTPTPTSVIPDAARFPFEDGTQQGWILDAPGMVGMSLSNSAAVAHAGLRSLALSIQTSGTSYQAANMYVPSQYPAGTASAWIYLPYGAPGGLEARFYLQDKNWTWVESPPVDLVPGTWTQAAWALGSAVFANPVQRFGMRIGGSAPYSGLIYVDSVNFTDATPPTPTVTVTSTSTPFVADTARFTFEGGGTEGWAIEAPGGAGLSLANTTAMSHGGWRGLALGVSYTGTAYEAVQVALAGQYVSGTASAWVYLPYGAPGGIDVKFYVQDALWTWAEGPSTILVPGAWNLASWNLNAAVFSNPVQRIGLRIGNSQAYSGNLFIDSIDFASAPTPTPSRTPSRTASATASPTSTAPAPSASATRTASPVPTLSSSPSPTPSRTPSRTASATASPTPTASPVPTLSFSPSTTRTFSPAPTWSFTLTPSFSMSPTFSRTPTVTPSFTHSPQVSPTPTPTSSPTLTASASSTPSPSHSSTATVTQTASQTRSWTPTGTLTGTPTASTTPSISPTFTPSRSMTPSFSATSSSTASRTSTATFTLTSTFTSSPSATSTPQMTFTATPSVTPVHSPSPTGTPDITVTRTPTQPHSAANAIARHAFSPNPSRGEGGVAFKLEGPADEVELRIYTRSMAFVASSRLSHPRPGWLFLALPSGLGLPSGTYYYRIKSLPAGAESPDRGTGKFVLLR